ncbi:hypothetical protein LX15_001486 [Streptoalloteichus tenebrarius]|uniref:Secreted protein n=1 Tax=Streptoalloteichus tenebrarius (strain ATCC 17920 / DSM 40477 / JCM 4838 / CBS 697.72 / NBRC 16177 / NCIMB 11028 / NRRL B-12390 / A12253. 1 / ISP 5477) TaxID=1933 RepID=A0ABT1HQK8_STRSD|nr:hypothetical protein [Streptoalloteichus tenebrarius]
MIDLLLRGIGVIKGMLFSSGALTAAVVWVRVIVGEISECHWEVWVGSGAVRAHRRTTGANRLVMLSAAPFSSPSRAGFEGRLEDVSSQLVRSVLIPGCRASA